MLFLLPRLLLPTVDQGDLPQNVPQGGNHLLPERAAESRLLLLQLPMEAPEDNLHLPDSVDCTHFHPLLLLLHLQEALTDNLMENHPLLGDRNLHPVLLLPLLHLSENWVLRVEGWRC